MRMLRLREWTTTAGVELTSMQRQALRTRFRATVQPTISADNRYDITPCDVLGAIVVDDAAMLVEPKLPISRVLFLLSYAADPYSWRPDDARLGVLPDLVTGVAGLFTRLSERALRRGLLTGYHDLEDDLATVRGRIDLAEQLRRRPGLDLPLAVRYNEHDDDVVENRLLLAAALQLARLPIRSPDIRRAIRRLTDALTTVTITHFPTTAVPEVAWNRLNIHYRAPVELARLLLQLRTPELAAGNVVTAGLTIDMAALCETFVRVALRDALHASDVQFPSGDDCPSLHLDTARRVRLRPDLSYWRGRSCVYVGDVKYKRDGGPGQHDDLYQLLAYATATQLPRAMLIYAAGPPAPLTHLVAPPGIQLQIRHLDLTQPPSDILEQLTGIADEIATAAVVARAHRDVPEVPVRTGTW